MGYCKFIDHFTLPLIMERGYLVVVKEVVFWSYRFQVTLVLSSCKPFKWMMKNFVIEEAAAVDNHKRLSEHCS